MIYASYFEDDASDELANNPVLKSVLEKTRLHIAFLFGLGD